MPTEERALLEPSELVERRARLGELRRRLQLRLGFGATSLAALLRLFQEQPAAVAIVLVGAAGLGAYAVVGVRDYRRQRRAAGLDHEFDELEYNAGFGARFLIILFGVFAAVGVVIYLVLKLAMRLSPPG